MKEQIVNDVPEPFCNPDLTEVTGRGVAFAEAKDAPFRQSSPRLQVHRQPASQRLAIKTNGRILFIETGELLSIRSQGNYVVLQKHSCSHLLRASISDIATKLERYGFIRIHRSVLVNILFVEEIEAYDTGEYGLHVRGGKVYTVSRTYKKNLRALADCWIGTDPFAKD